MIEYTFLDVSHKTGDVYSKFNKRAPIFIFIINSDIYFYVNTFFFLEYFKSLVSI